jgi:hypothetical protein
MHGHRCRRTREDPRRDGCRRANTGHSPCATDFLLTWRIATDCGGFDLTDLRAVGTAIAPQHAGHGRFPGAEWRECPTADGLNTDQAYQVSPPLSPTARGSAAKTSATQRWPGRVLRPRGVHPTATRREFFGFGRCWLSRFPACGVRAFLITRFSR